MRINYRFTDSLQHHSLIEPMFMDDFNLGRLEVDSQFLDSAVTTGTPIPVRLSGAGFRRRAEICLNGVCVTDPPLTNTGLYHLTFRKPAGRVWIITYRLGQRMASKNFDIDVDGLRTYAPTIDAIENPSTNKAEGLSSGGYTVIIRGSNLQTVRSVSFGPAEVIGLKIKKKHSNVLLVEVPKGQPGGVEVLLKGAIPPEGPGPIGQSVSNILDFITPGKAIFKYVAPPEKPAATKPAEAIPVKKKQNPKAARQS